MSRLAALLVLALGSSALADTAEPPASSPKTEEATPTAKSSKFPLRVVKILSDSEQALLFDKNRGRHVLVEVGDTIGDYTIAAITEDEVTLAGTDMPVEVVLASPEAKKKPAAKPVAKKPVAKSDVAPEDPYSEKAPADPYGEEAEEPREVSATDGAEKPIRATHWGKSEGEKTTTSPIVGDVPKPSEEVAKRGEMSTTEEDAPAKPVEAKPATNAPTKLAKKDWQVALADFGALAAAVDGEFTATGLELSKVARGSIFAKAGLQAGDVITAVDGKPLKSLDDAADLYARAGSMKSTSVQLTRAGKPQTLRIQIQ